jgi:hypothetical protein
MYLLAIMPAEMAQRLGTDHFRKVPLKNYRFSRPKGALECASLLALWMEALLLTI